MPAQQGNTVRIHYTGTLDDGDVFDSSRERDPLEFTLGSGQVIAGFDAGVLGMEPGDTKTISIPPEEAYGESHPDLIDEVGRDRFPEGLDIKPGMQFQATRQDGQNAAIMVTAVSEDSVTIDANHPLAGETLIFELELVEIVG